MAAGTATTIEPPSTPASTTPAAAAAGVADTLPDARRISEHDADFTRLRTATIGKLTRSLAQYVRVLRSEPSAAHHGAALAFIQRQVAILQDAYLAAHHEGSHDYWQSVSRTPERWERGTRRTPVDPQQVARRLHFYAPSVAKMAHEAQAAWWQEQLATQRRPAQGGTLSDGDSTATLMLADGDMGEIPTSPFGQEGSFLVTGGEHELEDWQAGVGVRIRLQAELTWAGLQDGYRDAGAGDVANPYALLWWDLDPSPSVRHCLTCPEYAAGSPYDAPSPSMAGHQLDATPGDGHSECGAACKCSLRFSGGEEVDFRGSVWERGTAGQDIPPAPPGIVTPGVKPGAWPPVTPSRFLGQTRQEAAMDDYRAANDRWERVRGDLPALPRMFGVDSRGAPGDWVAWDDLSYAQRAALRQVYDALAAFYEASGRPTLEETQAALEASTQDLDTFAARMQARADQLDQFVQDLNAANELDFQERFPASTIKLWLNYLKRDFDELLEWFYEGRTGNGTSLSERAGMDDASTYRLNNPNHYGPGERGGQFMPKGGGDAGGGGGGTGRQRAPGVRVTIAAAHAEQVRQTMHTLFGHELSDREVAKLAGALRGSEVTIAPMGTNLHLTVEGKTYRADHFILAPSAGHGLTVYNNGFTPKPRMDPHTEAKWLREQVQGASALGATALHVKCRSGTNDFERLPFFGYDTRVPSEGLGTEYRSPIPGALRAGMRQRGEETIWGLMHVPGGREWWHANGLNPSYDFNLARGSASRDRFDSYLRSHGLPGLDEGESTQ